MAAQTIEVEAFSQLEMTTPHWYALYTRVHQERRVEEKLRNLDLETFVPMYCKPQRAGNKRAVLERPLFSGYVFARFRMQERLRVVTTAGVCRIVGKKGYPEPLPEAEIDGLMNATVAKMKTHPCLKIPVGKRVRITEGPFEGVEGTLVRHRGQFRAVISLEAISSAFAIEVDEWAVEPVKSCPLPQSA